MMSTDSALFNSHTSYVHINSQVLMKSLVLLQTSPLHLNCAIHIFLPLKRNFKATRNSLIIGNLPASTTHLHLHLHPNLLLSNCMAVNGTVKYISCRKYSE